MSTEARHPELYAGAPPIVFVRFMGAGRMPYTAEALARLLARVDQEDHREVESVLRRYFAGDWARPVSRRAERAGRVAASEPDAQLRLQANADPGDRAGAIAL